MSSRKVRGVSQVIDSLETYEGEGFLVHRPFPTGGLEQVDPFLLLDEMGPVELGPGEAKGAPDHPHRGFETVTYVIDGALEHKDSRGHHGKLAAGDVQWMTAGSGVIHSEMPSSDFARSGGRLHAIQLWVNLPRRDKMMAPRYQEFRGSEIPSATSADGRVHVRVIAGEALGARAVIETRTPIMYLHFRLGAGARVEQPVPEGFTTLAYVLSGAGLAGSPAAGIRRGQLAVFEPRDGDVALEAGAEPLEVLVIAGAPLKEPMARYGPFVMNTKAEVLQAFEDYRSGRMGSIDF